MTKTHLLIPDGHAHPDHTNKRFEYIGKLIKDIKPDVVINIGDLWDMASLCSYDKGTKSFEGRRYDKDVASGVEALDMMNIPMKRAKKKMPRKVFTLGNHEHRIERAIETEAILAGTIGYKDLQLKEHGWEVYSFLKPVVIDDIAYCHYFSSGVMNRPIGGVHPAASLLDKRHMSASQGHAHTLDFSVDTKADGRKIMGLVCGCYQDYRAKFAGPANDLWWSGVVIKRNVDKGVYDPQFISITALEKEYGDG